jgi:cytoskeletal protein CcmA (bactofilin family)
MSNSTTPPTSAPATPVSETTHIAKTTVIKGEVRLEGPATIAGKIEGGVVGKDVEVLAEGNVEGDISCGQIELNGNVKGNVTATKSCKLGATARVAGEIRTANLGISEGAVFVGQVFVGGSATQKSESSSPVNRIEGLASDDSSDSVNVLSGNVQKTLNNNAPKVAPRPYAANGGAR